VADTTCGAKEEGAGATQSQGAARGPARCGRATGSGAAKEMTAGSHLAARRGEKEAEWAALGRWWATESWAARE
jgi:hypothetical protein